MRFVETLRVSYLFIRTRRKQSIPPSHKKQCEKYTAEAGRDSKVISID